jgi:uncharacterized membrane protein YuzA (DUF378 family)
MAKQEMSTLCKVAFGLLVVGGLNWLLVGLGNFFGGSWDLVQLLLGGVPVLRDIVYVLVGLAAVYSLVGMFKK